MFNKYSDLQEAANDKSVYEHRALGGSGVRRIGRQQFLWMTRHSGCLSMDVVRSCLYIVTNIGIIDEGDAENGMSILSTLHQRKVATQGHKYAVITVANTNRYLNIP